MAQQTQTTDRPVSAPTRPQVVPTSQEIDVPGSRTCVGQVLHFEKRVKKRYAFAGNAGWIPLKRLCENTFVFIIKANIVYLETKQI